MNLKNLLVSFVFALFLVSGASAFDNNGPYGGL
jgi:hypothetical protein